MEFKNVQELLWSHICLNVWDRLVNIASISPKAYLVLSHTVQIAVFAFSSGGMSSRAAQILSFFFFLIMLCQNFSLELVGFKSPDTEGVCLRGIRS